MITQNRYNHCFWHIRAPPFLVTRHAHFTMIEHYWYILIWQDIVSRILSRGSNYNEDVHLYRWEQLTPKFYPYLLRYPPIPLIIHHSLTVRKTICYCFVDRSIEYCKNLSNLQLTDSPLYILCLCINLIWNNRQKEHGSKSILVSFCATLRWKLLASLHHTPSLSSRCLSSLHRHHLSYCLSRNHPNLLHIFLGQNTNLQDFLKLQRHLLEFLFHDHYTFSLSFVELHHFFIRIRFDFQCKSKDDPRLCPYRTDHCTSSWPEQHNLCGCLWYIQEHSFMRG